jgi:hypothetical protein
MTVALRNPQTVQLLNLLHDAGFDVPAEDHPWVGASEGYVEHPGTGIWIHVTAEMVRLVVPADDDLPEYRMILAWRDLHVRDALRIIAVHARAALARKENGA